MTTRTTIFATNDVLTANDLNSLAGGWNAYTPTLAQGASTDIAKTVTYAKYLQFGKLVICQVRLAATAAGATGLISVSLPVTAATSNLYIGSGMVLDGTVYYMTTVYMQSTTVVRFNRTDSLIASDVGADPSFTIASGDQVAFNVMYEAA